MGIGSAPIDATELPVSHACKAFVVQGQSLLAVRRGLGDMHYAGQWDLPGGSAEAGETEIDGLKREVWQSTGLTVAAAPEPFAETEFLYPEKAPVRRVHVAAYLALGQEEIPSSKQVDSEHVDQVKWVPFEDLPRTKFIAGLRPLIQDFTALFVAEAA